MQQERVHTSYIRPLRNHLLLCFILIAKCSAVLTPVVNSMQKKSMDMVKVCEHMAQIEELFISDRNEADRITAEILERAEYFAEELEIENRNDPTSSSRKTKT